MAQPITDYAAFFAGAKQAVDELEHLNQKADMLLDKEKRLENTLKTKKKELSDTVTKTVRQREDEIAKSYDAESDKTQERLKKVIAKREKAKSQGVKERISEETQSLKAENADLARQMKNLFHANKVPAYCRNGYYYSMYFTRGLKEFLTLLVTLLICFLAIPCGAYFLIPERKTWYLFAIYVIAILIFGGIYVAVGNMTKSRYMDVLKEGRGIRNQISANKKKMKKVEKSIRKDKNDSLYNLQKFDDEIAQLEQDLSQTAGKKKEALNTFMTVTKTIISDEISGNYKVEIDKLEADLSATTAELTETRSAAKEKALGITDQYATYVGKDFITRERLDALEQIIQSGKASNLSEAVAVFKSGDYKETVGGQL